MGDCLLLTSPIRALKDEFPRFRITVLVESRFAGCFEENPDIDEVLSFSRKSEAFKLAARRFDLVLNLHGGPTSLAYAMLARAARIGLEQFQYRRLYQALIPSHAPYFRSVQATLASFQWLDVEQKIARQLR